MKDANRRSPAIVIIGGSKLGVKKIRWANEVGLKSIVIDRNKNAPGFTEADVEIVADRTDELSLIRECIRYKDLYDIKLVYCGIDLSIIPTVLAMSLGLKTNSIIAAATVQDKWLMKKAMLLNGVQTPKAKICYSLSDIESLKEEYHFPLIVKAVGSSGSRGISIVNSESDLYPAIEDAMRYSSSGSYLIEEFIYGTMHDINGFFWENQFYPCGIMDRFFHDNNQCLSSMAIDPTSLAEIEQLKAYREVEKACRACGIETGPVKADIVWSQAEPFVLEISNRFHGDIQTCYTAPLGSGINAMKGYFELLRTSNLNMVYFKPKQSNIAGWKGLVCPPGIFKEIKGIDEARSINGVEDVIVYAHPGKQIGNLTDNTQIPGVIIASGRDKDELFRIFREAENKIKIVTK